MKSFLSHAALVAAMFGLSSCCCLFSGLRARDYRVVTKRACGHDTVVQEVPVAGSKGGLTETVTTKVPRYKQVKEFVPCGPCVRYYCPKEECCGGSGQSIRNLASAQGPVGSPHIGLVPTMRPIAP